MAGIIFFNTQHINEIRDFYISQIGMEMWLDQGGCIILKHDNLLLGFCAGNTVDNAGIITFFYPSKDAVDAMRQRVKSIALDAPVQNEKYRIYQFFAKDPEGRTLEFQTFLHPLPPYQSGDALLRTRRSIRKFKEQDIPESLIRGIIENCRFAPSSCNRQPVYYVVIRRHEILEFLAGTRGTSTAPIAGAPMAVAIVSDPNISIRPKQDGDIAAYHFLLAASLHGLGCCWMAAMDREDVKDALGIPQNHFIATITPVGHPDEDPEPPPRKEIGELVQNIPAG